MPYADEVRAEPSVRTRPEERSVARELSRLAELNDLCEKAMVALVDARGRLEDRLAPVLTSSPVGSLTSPAWPDRDQAGCALAEVIGMQCRRLEHLHDSIASEERFVREIADRLEV